MTSQLPIVAILATGGTIAGLLDSHSTDYKAGVLDIDSLIQALPQLQNIQKKISLHTEQIANIDSAHMNEHIWLSLAQRVNELLNNPDIQSIIITHGTDTLEESAFFLHLCTKSHKPIIFTGAMRPFDAPNYDGLHNLSNALLLAINPHAQNRGVIVTMNDRIFGAQDVSKTHTLSLDAFFAPNNGDMGYIVGERIFFYTQPSPRIHFFDISSLQSLPRVEILYSYAGDGLATATLALVKEGLQALVIAGSGAGSIHINHKNILKTLMQEGLIVVQSSRINSGRVLVSKEDAHWGFIGSGGLNPQKARVLLLLSLTTTQDRAEIAHIFDAY